LLHLSKRHFFQPVLNLRPFQGRLNTGDHVALIYAPGVDLIAAFYGCLYVGVVPVTIRPPHPQVSTD
jgi:acyl-CoA synthetase (AMP-forming)/AMP-acid ligase II